MHTRVRVYSPTGLDQRKSQSIASFLFLIPLSSSIIMNNFRHLLYLLFRKNKNVDIDEFADQLNRK